LRAPTTISITIDGCNQPNGRPCGGLGEDRPELGLWLDLGFAGRPGCPDRAVDGVSVRGRRVLDEEMRSS
jgi:hypothetical protein